MNKFVYKGSSLIPFAIISAILLTCFLCFVLLPFFGWHLNTGTGTHTGIITGATKSGIVFKTNRIYFQTSKMSSKANAYCVPNEKVYKKLSAISDGNTQVVIYYKSWLVNGVINCDGEDNYVYAVKRVGDK